MLADDPSSGSKVAEARRLAARLRELVDDGRGPRRDRRAAARLHPRRHVRARARRGRASTPTWSAAAASGPSSRSRTCAACWPWSPTRSTTRRCSARSPRPACGVLPDTLWLLRRAATAPRRERPRRALPRLAADPRPGRATASRSEGDAEAAALIPEDELERLRGFATALGELRARGHRGRPRGAGRAGRDRASATTSRPCVRDDGEARWANVRKLMRLAREFESREGPDLAGFLDYLDARAAQRDREAEAATRAEGHAGVRVMTVHAAKGLEFGVVAVADLGRKPATRLDAAAGRARRASARRRARRRGSASSSAAWAALGAAARLRGADRAAPPSARPRRRAASPTSPPPGPKRRLLLSGTFNPNEG